MPVTIKKKYRDMEALKKDESAVFINKQGGRIYPSRPGDPGNPGAGRPKGSRNIKTIIRMILETTETSYNPLTKKEEDMTQNEIITFRLVAKARKGDIKAIKELWDRGYGQSIQQTHNVNENVEDPMKPPAVLFPEENPNIIDAKATSKS